ncbi:hypothetical protein AMECASPLE_026316 [Ameca splendens]|uniref:Uncharacterized protein n=1 Tax=Ameca splendens TaxID=208324 RepID=A0ABV0Y564_9TELE
MMQRAVNITFMGSCGVGPAMRAILLQTSPTNVKQQLSPTCLCSSSSSFLRSTSDLHSLLPSPSLCFLASQKGCVCVPQFLVLNISSIVSSRLFVFLPLAQLLGGGGERERCRRTNPSDSNDQYRASLPPPSFSFSFWISFCSLLCVKLF